MALNNNALVTLALAKVYLDVKSDDASFDTLFEMLINAASQAIENYCNRVFKSATYTQFFDGKAQNEILLPTFPVTSITSINVDSSRIFGIDSLIDVADYALNGDSVRLHSGTFGEGSQIVKVVYTAGFATIPSDLQMACLLYIDYLYRYKQDRRVGKTSIGKNGENTGFVTGIPIEITAMLEVYRRQDLYAEHGSQAVGTL